LFAVKVPLTVAAFWVSLAVAGNCLAQSTTSDLNWPQWRGPQGTGAAVGNPPVKWDASTNIVWKVAVPGDGTSTPVIWGDKIFLQAAGPVSGERSGPTTASGKASGNVGAQGPPGERGKSFGPPKGDFGGKGEFGGKKGFGGKGPPPGGKGGKLGPGSIPAPTEPYQFMLLCIDKTSGKTLWQKVCREEVPHEGYRLGDGGYATASAITDGEHVIAFFGSRGLYCLDLDGNLVWEKDLGDQMTRNGFGEGATPALHKDTIVVPWDHEGADFIVAIDKRTGNELWRRTRDEPTTWATPLIVEHAGGVQVVMPGTNRLISYDLATGKTVWETEGLTLNAIPTPVTADGIVYALAGYQGSKLLAIRLGGRGDITGTSAVLWRQDKDTPYVPSPLLVNNRLYFFKSNDAFLTCLDARTGKPHYAAVRIGDLGARVYASPVAAGGHVYLVGRNGTTVVIRDADKLETVSTNLLDDPIDASPAFSGDLIFLRSRENLYCIGQK
jgi:outer membrane protein assembly factor BamB